MKPYSMLKQVTLGSQLRMLSEMVTSDAAAIYQQFDLAIDPKWFPVFYVLASEPGSTASSIASTIGHSHVSVGKILTEMGAAKLIVSKKSNADSRRTLVSLSVAGKRLVPKLMKQCESVDRALTQLADETGVDFGHAVATIQRSLKYFPLSERVRDLDAENDLRLIDYTSKYLEDFKRLNVEWITKFWDLEDADKKALNSPEEYIIDKGGAIFIALYKGSAVGSAALIPYDNVTLELAKMAVSPLVQGKGIGIELGEFAMKRARLMGSKRVYLESNSLLTPALSLYRKLGFKNVNDTKEISPYERCDVRMEKLL